MFCFRQIFCVCIHKKTILSYGIGQKLSSKLLFIIHQIVIDFTYFIFHKVM